MFLGSWKIVHNGKQPDKLDDTLEFVGDGLLVNGTKFKYSWIYNEYAISVDHSETNIVIYVYDAESALLFGYPVLQKNAEFHFKYERTSPAPDVKVSTELSPHTKRVFRLGKWKGKHCNASIVEITDTEYVNKKYKRRNKITHKHNPYSVVVTFDSGKWMYIVSMYSSMKLYGMPIEYDKGYQKYFGRYYPYTLQQLHGRKRIGYYRNKLLKDRNKISGWDYVNFITHCPYMQYETVHVYRDELLQKDYNLKDHCDVLVMGGGLASHWDKALTEVGCYKLLKFVKEGGAFFGVCALAANATYRGTHWGWGLVRADLTNKNAWRRGTNKQCRVKYTKDGVDTLWDIFKGHEVEDIVRFANGPVFDVISNEEYKANREEYAEGVQYEPLKDLILSTLELPDPRVFSVFVDNVANTASSKDFPMNGLPNLIGNDFGEGRVAISSGHMEHKLVAQCSKYLVDWLVKERP